MKKTVFLFSTLVLLSCGANVPLQSVAPGQTMGRYITVAPGDSVYSIARKNSTTAKSIISHNNLRAPYTLLSGQRLYLTKAQTHRVRRGESLYTISRRYGVDMTSLARLNHLSSPHVIHPGEQLRIPEQTYRPVTVARRPPRQSTPTALTKVAYTPPPNNTAQSTRFRWPASGKIISTYGEKDNGIHNDGINILSERGTPVYAARDGVVVYTGKDLETYGNMILVKHTNNYITAYAHTGNILVHKGARVTRNTRIATVGSSGNVSKPQLHFEIRKGRKAVDPLNYLTRS